MRGVPWRLIGWSGAASLLLAPLVAMQFTDEVAWTASDFGFAAVVFGTVGLALELAVRRSGSAAYRTAVGLALLASLLIVWITGAVGIIGDEGQIANLLFLGVVAIAFLGSAAALFRPAGMARAMALAAAAQLLVPPIALASGLAPAKLVLSLEVPGLTVALAAMWLGSAALFRKAAAEQPASA